MGTATDLGWGRGDTPKALNGEVCLGCGAELSG